MTEDERNAHREDPSSAAIASRDRFAAAADRFTDRWAPLVGVVEDWARYSRFNVALERFAAIGQEAWLVRWLTTEPDPEPIVIDLRESWFLGPPLSILQRVAPRLDAARRTSSARRAGRVVGDWTERYAVPAVSLLVLGFVVWTVATTWRGASPLWLSALTIAGLAGVLGLGVDRSRDALERSRFVRVMVALLAPPAADESGADPRR